MRDDLDVRVLTHAQVLRELNRAAKILRLVQRSFAVGMNDSELGMGRNLNTISNSYKRNAAKTTGMPTSAVVYSDMLDAVATTETTILFLDIGKNTAQKTH